MSLHHAVLGFLSGGPRSRSEISADFALSVGHFWTADQTDVNHTLRRSVETGLVTREPSGQGAGPDGDDVLYQLTRRGQAVLDDWLHSPEEFYPMREPFLLRLFFAGRLDPDIVSRLIADHIDSVSKLLDGLQKIAADIGREFTKGELPLEDRLRLSTLDLGLAYAEAELRWATRLHDEMSTGEPTKAQAAAI